MYVVHIANIKYLLSERISSPVEIYIPPPLRSDVLQEQINRYQSDKLCKSRKSNHSFQDVWIRLCILEDPFHPR